MAKFDEQLSRMSYLMGYKMPVQENKSNIEYYTEGADGKVYGILRENNKYYIKTTEKGKETIAESYDYINGFNYRNENGFTDYNKATKKLELKMISLNEAYGVHDDVSTVDFNRSEKTFTNLTESARKELNRMMQIMENVNTIGITANIGDHGDPEGKHKSNPSNTEENNDPFSEKATPKMEKEVTYAKTTPEKVNDFEDASKSVESKLESDKNPKCSENDGMTSKDVEINIDGESVATQNPKGGKAVMVNEDWISDETPIEDENGFSVVDQMPLDGDEFEDLNADEFEGDTVEDEAPVDGEAPVGDDIVGVEDDGIDTSMDDDLDAIYESVKDICECDCKDGECKCAEKKGEDALKGKKAGKKNLPVQTTDRLNESQIKRIVNRVCESIMKDTKKAEKKVEKTAEEKLNEAIRKIVKESLNEFGKHPKYGQEPMTTPENPNGDGKKVGTADKDWNHSSAKGDNKYGKKVINGKPFDQVVNTLTDSVMKMVAEQYGVKKK